MTDLDPDASPSAAAQWVVHHVPFTIAAQLLVGGMLSDLTTGQIMIGETMAAWLEYDPEQVRQFEDWSIQRRLTVWTT